MLSMLDLLIMLRTVWSSAGGDWGTSWDPGPVGHVSRTRHDWEDWRERRMGSRLGETGAACGRARTVAQSAQARRAEKNIVP
jgi:hypothetical protein